MVKLSIIIPVFNEEIRIKACLESIFSQNFPKKEMEILIIDDDSEDKTVEIVKKFPVKILRNGHRDYDLGKAIGINKAKGKFIMFIDADNRLKDSEFLNKAISVLEKNSSVLGVQAWKFQYSEKHNIATRYQDLMGGVDPFVFYLRNQDHLEFYKKEWNLKGRIVENSKDYVIIKFNRNNFPTMGSQGFVTRRSYFPKGMGKFQHIEYLIKLQDKTKGDFCFIKDSVEHLGFKSVSDIIHKLSRNMDHYVKDIGEEKQERYALSFGKILWNVIKMETVILPLYDSLKGYIKIRDSAWFLHIYLSFLIPWIYAYKFLIGKLK